ncbi:unnamed protein product [Vitrella brassicaformis CCMP3155]|uniref:AP2/ERF domain-containing protein n=1 Tax=Vitrella brassicaformis (strain CCMP3155) TaxID=1169540 RepID=A0A0G4GLI1_VITBC|nr:unnamed protein product [Vitrella brassicaformis CCMP3155]|eukprot:CEM30976.1 unnamed protein product [Vitrella brassicaformis CCMP3155]
MWAGRMAWKSSSSVVSGGKGKGKGKKAAGASSSVSANDYEAASTAGASSTRAPTGSGAGDDLDNMTHVGGATQVSGSTDEQMTLSRRHGQGGAGSVASGSVSERMALDDRFAAARSEVMPLNDRLGRKRQARNGAAGGRVGGDPSDDEGGSSDDQGSSDDDDDENDEDYNPPDDNDDDNEDEDDEPESSGSGGDHLSDSTFKQPQATGKPARPATSIHQSTVRGVRFDDKNQRWVANLKEGGNWTKKHFAVSLFGHDEAKAEAEECRLQNEHNNEEAGRPIKSPNKSDVPGVYRDDKQGRWVAVWRENGKQKKDYFSVAKLGEEGARREAIKRRELVEKIWPDQRKSLSAQTACTLSREHKKLIDQLPAKVKGVYFHRVPGYNAWIAHWSVGGKQRSKNFAFSTHDDIEKAYERAVACRKEKEASGAASIQQPVERQSGLTGVSWRKKSKAWVASWYNVSGKQQKRDFRVSAYKDDCEAKAAAIHWRDTMVEQTEREKQDRIAERADRQMSRKRPVDASEGRRLRRKRE